MSTKELVAFLISCEVQGSNFLAVKDEGGDGYQPYIALARSDDKEKWLIVPTQGDNYRIHNLYLGTQKSLVSNPRGGPPPFKVRMETTDPTNPKQLWALSAKLDPHIQNSGIRFFAMPPRQEIPHEFALTFVWGPGNKPPFSITMAHIDLESLLQMWTVYVRD